MNIQGALMNMNSAVKKPDLPKLVKSGFRHIDYFL